ncbi:hypothetical protein BSKO_05856 [Bryopsis sp. KO-2023]|nr:hypothetical protein BSKO_05856 [Bryopsis sp. KO-2023]
MGLLGAFVLSCLLVGLAVADDEHCHTPTVSNVGSVPALAGDVCKINGALGTSPPDFVTAKAIYRSALKDVATASRSTPTWVQYNNFFGGAGWMDDILDDAFDKTTTSTTKRVQIIKKVLQGTVLTQEMLYHAESALSSYEDGDAEEALISWEKGMAAFYGEDVDCAPFGNGQARGIEFGLTMKGVGNAAYNIAATFGAGAEAIEEGEDAGEVADAIKEIKRNVVIVYVQSVAKYATLIDQAIERGDDFEKAQGEGFGYLHAILPILNDANARDASKILAVFNPANEPSEEEAEEVLDLLKKMYGALGVSASEIKSFDGSRSGRFSPPSEVACEAFNPFVGVGVKAVDVDK